MIKRVIDEGFEFLSGVKKLSFSNKMFPILALIFGLIIIKIVPPLQAPDELGHFVKAEAFSERKIRPQPSKKIQKNKKKTWNEYGFEMPYEILSMNSYLLNKGGKGEKYPYYYVDKEKSFHGVREFVPTGGITNYYWASYIPQILGIEVGKMFGKPIIWQYYATRYFNLIAYILIIFFSIKLFPFSKLGATVLALNPMALSLAASASGDAMIIATSFFFTSWILNMIRSKKITNIELLISAFLMVTLVLMKPTLIVLGMLFFLIPNKNMSIQRKIAWGIGIFTACIFFYLAWNKLMVNQQLLYKDFANPEKQVDLFFKSPSVFFENVKENYLFGVKGDNIIYSFAGNFGFLDAPLGLHWLILYFAMIPIACLVQDKDNISLNAYQKIISVVMMIIYILLTFFALYQIWNKPGRTASIEGLQGRYFIPLSIVLVPLFSSKHRILNIKAAKVNSMVFICILLILIASILTLSTRYPGI